MSICQLNLDYIVLVVIRITSISLQQFLSPTICVALLWCQSSFCSTWAKPPVEFTHACVHAALDGRRGLTVLLRLSCASVCFQQEGLI